MSVEELVDAQHKARKWLIQFARDRGERDMRIRYAAALGIPKTEIAAILGMNRGHISDIANAKPGGSQSASEAEGPAQQLKDDTP